jgi:hypothetical protein
LNATEVTAYQYLGMTKIAGALNMLPKTILDEIITNDSTNEAIKIYQADRNSPKFYRNFLNVMEKFVLASIKLNLSVGYALTIFSSLSYDSEK